MAIIVGIDVGGSTTKIVGFTAENRTLLAPIFVKATDPVASVYGAFGKFTAVNKVTLRDIIQVMITGVGSSAVGEDIYGIPAVHVDEFTAIGRGGLYLSHFDEAIIISMGTGTALVHARAKQMRYLGGTGVGGGTLVGLSKKLLSMQDVAQVSALAEEGNLENIDLRIKHITERGARNALPPEMTASNFGNVSDIASHADMALGIINLVFETIGMMGLFAARSAGLKDIVLTGNLTTIGQCGGLYANMGKMFGVDFCIPENAQYATVIGTALQYFDHSSGKDENT